MKTIIAVLGLVGMCHVINAIVPAVTGTFKPTPPGHCDISMKAFGMQDTGTNMVKSSYIKVNGLTYVDTSGPNSDLRGFDMVLLDMNTCKASNFAHFDTWASPPQSDELANYIYSAPDGAHILAVTSDDAFDKLQPSAKAALKSIGVDASGRVYADKMLFHAVKGRPDKTVTKIGKVGEENLFYEEKAATCEVCENGGYLKVNDAGTGFECQCLKIYKGLRCEKFSEAGCVDHYQQTENSVNKAKRYLTNQA